VFTAPFELFFKSNLSLPRLSALPHLPIHRSACVGAGLAWRQPWSAAFLLILMRVRRSLGLRLGAGSRSPSVLTDTFLQEKSSF